MSTKQGPTAKQDAPAAQQLETVTLIAPHTHADKECKVGDKIEVTPTEKDWLIRHERIAAPAGQAAAAEPAKE
ncbi:hypothetical protein [Pseudomonas sp. AU12215]|uniref:DUF7210 family protein n=1 Tax=Pseudomonas sp. AU12215 TaxID=1860123 RepID=UPI0007EE387A|nr:hypothetical protein [Pseudomonas sp. AU12215]OBY58238.1 hypothetical protein A9513_012105 [Pseudomonas sp. AU12215]